MDRLQKKCFAASAGLHLLLGAILIFGPAFLTPDKAPRRPGLPNPEDPPVGQVFTLVPEQAVAAPSQPPSAAETTVSTPDQPRPSTSAPRASNTKPVLPTEAKPAAHPARSSNTRASGRDTRAEQFDKIIKDIHQGTSPATKIEFGINIAGGGDDAYAQYVREKYTTSWDLSGASAANDSAVVKVTVTIANDGKVVESKIVSFSGNAEVDRSVAGTLSRVNMIRPFGEGARNSQRTYTINFRCNTKGN